ncbi:MAG: hypothetical protein A4E45_01734 [Methanosaeta sp. PtaB.Bin039]|nr:MAG: hypothetical protein A4E45_01734 [Methanosaeta sp. PtaB.Bin039]
MTQTYMGYHDQNIRLVGMLIMRSTGIVIAISLTVMLIAQTGAQTNHYVAVDPAVKEMKESLDAPRAPTYVGSAQSESIPKTALVEVAGGWHLELTDGITIDLALNQSVNAVFGRGNITMPAGSQSATASGRISETDLLLDVVPESGMEIYVISLNLSQLPLNGKYTRIGTGSEYETGTLIAGWMPHQTL